MAEENIIEVLPHPDDPTKLILNWTTIQITPTVSIKEIKERRFCTSYEYFKDTFPDIKNRWELLDI